MYFLVALRRLVKERIYVAVNILSLALGIGSFLILALYLRSELTFDRHFENHENIYRLSTHFTPSNAPAANFALTQEGIGPLLVGDYPQIGDFVRFRNASQSILRYEELSFDWENIYLVDENVFDVFSHEIISGDVETAMDNPASIAISASMARAYFGDEDAVGKVLQSDSLDYRVTLVFADLPENTHLKYDALYPYRILAQFTPNYEDNYTRSLGGVGQYTYFRISPEFDLGSFPGLIDEFKENYMSDVLTRMNAQFDARLTPLADIHFGESLPGDQPNGNVFYLFGFGAVAAFILIIACINYMNLATARATKRSQEVGMRKVVGATRRQLMLQFLGESAVFTAIALMLGIVAAVFALAFTPIGTLMEKESLLAGLVEPSVLLGLISLAVIVALVSGLYPAFYLSAISPKAALTRVRDSWRSGLSIRQLLVLAQLMISIGVIAATLLMSQQMRYISSKPLGFDKENQVMLTLRGADLIEQFPTLRNELLANPNIIEVVDTNMIPGFGNAINMIPMEDNDGVMNPEQIDRIMVGLNFINGLGIEVLEGRAFSEEMGTDAENAMMVNEAMVRKMGWDEPIGKQIGDGPGFTANVIGVTADFHYAPLNNEIGPLLIQPFVPDYSETPPQTRPLQTRSLIINISGDAVGATLEEIEDTIRQFDPAQVFDPQFLDAELDNLYRAETNLMNLTEVFAGICILISAMGLFGLASFNTEQRNREIGVRKVLGASSSQIILMLCRNLSVLIVIAAIPAVVASYFTIENWLSRFAYRAEPGLFGTMLPFAIAVLLVAAIALITVALQSFKTAQSNPVQALRYE
ncbi:MAG: FtsX-like permease family protein [Gammaproteobacteria bacterium]